jgi:16S rRNA processing protein RimM
MPSPGATEPGAERRVVIGRIAGVHGIRGWVRVRSHTRPGTNILDYQPWLLGPAPGWREFRVDRSTIRRNEVLVHLEGVDDRDQAEPLIGSDIAVLRSSLPAPAAGEFYWCDLIGMTVRNRQGAVLGTVTGLLETGSNDVLVVQGRERTLIPFLTGRVILAVHAETGTIEVDWDPEPI